MKTRSIRYLTSILGHEVTAIYDPEFPARRLRGRLVRNDLAAGLEPGCYGFVVRYRRMAEERDFLLFPGNLIKHDGKTFVIR